VSRPLTTADPTPDNAAPTPTVRRRLAAMLYEGVLLFGIVFFAGYLFSALTQQRNGLTHHNLLAGWIGFVVGLYFVWFWTHGGQTLPMKTWRLRLVAANGTPVSAVRALVIAAVWFVLWAATGRFGASRQFLHDRLAGTRIVEVTR
jgi:uncharacterized RDD family membrane protein YckC